MKRINQFVIMAAIITLVGWQAWAGEFTLDEAKDLAIKAAALIEKGMLFTFKNMKCYEYKTIS